MMTFRSPKTNVLWAFLLIQLSLALVHLHGRDLDQPLLDSYDYIVVGCGISGLVVTNRLSENPSRTVLCIEAGQADHYEQIIQVPVYVGADIGGIYDWDLVTTPQNQLDGATRPMPQGKVLGGGSILNAMCWNRGGADDYDAWEELGNPGWGWDGMLPYFMRSETYTPVSDPDVAREYSINFNPAVHGTSGPVQVSYPRYFYPQSVSLFEAMNQLGLPTQFDPNDGTSAGPAFVPTDIDPQNQTRSDARRTYFDPYVHRSNFHVITNQHVTRILIEGVANNSQVSNPSTGGNDSGNGPSDGDNEGFGFGPGGSTPPIEGQTAPGIAKRQDPASSNLRIQGVEFAPNATAPRQVVYATREVIVAAGALHSAQLFQLSGIGPSSVLDQYGIPVALNLPGVGNNLQDHCLVGTFYPYNNASYPSPTELTTNATYNTEAEEEYETEKIGPWTAGSPNALAFNPLNLITNNTWVILLNASLQEPSDYLPPGLDSTLVAGFAAQKNSLVSRLGENHVAAYEIINNNAGSLTLSVMHPLSRGICQITSPNPFDPPAIDPRWLTNPVDRQVLVEALRFNRQILATPPMQLLQPAQFVPPVDADEDALDQIINTGIRTEFHPSGTLAMLPLEQGGVVDSHLRVWGTQNLRVVDAGIFPMIPAAHLQAVVYAVAEKAADIIRQDNLPSSAVPTSSATSVASQGLSLTASSSIVSTAVFTNSSTPVSTTIASIPSSVATSIVSLSEEAVGVAAPTTITAISNSALDARMVTSFSGSPASSAGGPVASATGAAESASSPTIQATVASATHGSIVVFTTTLPADLPAFLSSIHVQSTARRSREVEAHPSGPAIPGSSIDSVAELSASVVSVLNSVGIPPPAVSSLAPIIVGQQPRGHGNNRPQATEIEQLQHNAAIDAVLRWVFDILHMTSS